MVPHTPYSLFPVVNCGVDWLTCTNRYLGVSNALEGYGEKLLKEKFAAVGQVTTAKALGYVGHRAEGIFLGRNAQGVMLQLSGPACTPLAQEAITLSTGVSRIDYQVTVWTEGEACHLAKWTFNHMRRLRQDGVQRGGLRLIEGYPSGETLQVNQRVSDSFGRLYDKTAEAKLGAPLLLWRYEVEWKGREARRLASRLAKYGCHPTDVMQRVHAWYSTRGVSPAFDSVPTGDAPHDLITDSKRSVLDWFRRSLSITVSKAIKQHGREAVLDALGILDRN